jgi:hypothetical protein
VRRSCLLSVSESVWFKTKLVLSFGDCLMLDPMLKMFVELVEKEFSDSIDIEFPVTLLVKGLVVSGSLIASEKYIKGLASELEGKGIVGDAMSNGLLAGFQNAQEYISAEFELDSAENSVSPISSSNYPDYIHLKNAVVQSNGWNVSNGDLSLYRIRSSDIDGFALGGILSKNLSNA